MFGREGDFWFVFYRGSILSFEVNIWGRRVRGKLYLVFFLGYWGRVGVFLVYFLRKR